MKENKMISKYDCIAVLDRNGKIIATAKTERGASKKASILLSPSASPSDLFKIKYKGRATDHLRGQDYIDPCIFDYVDKLKDKFPNIIESKDLYMDKDSFDELVELLSSVRQEKKRVSIKEITSDEEENKSNILQVLLFLSSIVFFIFTINKVFNS